AWRAGLKLKAGQLPAHGAVLERKDVLHAESMQRTGADDAAGAAGAVDDDGGVRVVHEVPDAQAELGAGHRATTGDAGALVLFGRAGIEDQELVAAMLASVELVWLDLRDTCRKEHLF